MLYKYGPKIHKKLGFGKFGSFSHKNTLYTSKSYFSGFKNVKIFQKKKHCLGLLEDVFKVKILSSCFLKTFKINFWLHNMNVI